MDFIFDLEKAIFDICDGDRSHKLKLARKIITLEDMVTAFAEIGDN